MATLSIRRESFRLAQVFTISRGSRTHAEVVMAEIADGGHSGRGECVPYSRYGESVESVIAQIEGVGPAIRDGADRMAIQSLLPAGAARNAVDCAFWDLEAKRAGVPAWRLAGLAKAPGPLTTAYTLSLDTPENMGRAAAANAHRPLLKIKLTGEGDLPRVEAVRANAPTSRLIVDANEGWSAAHFPEYAPKLAALGVAMIEQPLHADRDGPLAEMARPIPVCADEACHDRRSLPKLVGKYDLVNIKLDKTGGLTEALALARAAREAGYGIMVGCMIGTSLAMAPAVLVAQGAEYVDLDAPLLLAEDRPDGLRYDGSIVQPPTPALWG
ncbi:MAG: dipeptide epimerase [Alphaproteobacteria bacterium]|nr:dipeptide epimerase [Alphaproteobacteria bacterium]